MNCSLGQPCTWPATPAKCLCSKQTLFERANLPRPNGLVQWVGACSLSDVREDKGQAIFMAGIGVLENAKLTHSAVVAASGWKSRTPKFMNRAI